MNVTHIVLQWNSWPTDGNEGDAGMWMRDRLSHLPGVQEVGFISDAQPFTVQWDEIRASLQTSVDLTTIKGLKILKSLATDTKNNIINWITLFKMCLLKVNQA